MNLYNMFKRSKYLSINHAFYTKTFEHKKHVSKSISWCKISSPLTNENCIHGLCEVVDVLIHKRLKEIKKNPLFSYPLTSSLELLKTFLTRLSEI